MAAELKRCRHTLSGIELTAEGRMSNSFIARHSLFSLVLCSAFLIPSLTEARKAPVAHVVKVVAPTPVQSVEGITEYRLANGLQVLLIPDDSKPTTTVNVTYRVGSRQESYGETGMAHLL